MADQNPSEDIRKALEVILANKKASVSLLQRKLHLGYGRAAEIMAHLESIGIVGPANGSQPRVIHFDKLSSALPSASPEPPPNLPPAPDDKANHALAPSADVSLRRGIETDAAETALATACVSSSARGNEPEGEPSVCQRDAGSTPALATKICVITYLPPSCGGKFFTDAYIANLKKNPPRHDLITFSEVPEFSGGFKPTLRLKRSIEVPGLETVVDQHNIIYGFNNLAFFLAFGFAWKMGYTHFIYGECDMRVRHDGGALNWDETILADFGLAQNQKDREHGLDAPENYPRLIVGGSMILWNPFNADRLTAQRACDLMAKWNTNLQSADVRDRNRFLPCYGAKGQGDASGACITCNGAGAVYSVAGLRTLFPELTDPDDNRVKINLAKRSRQYDFEIGKRLWHLHKADSFNYVAHLPVIFSSYGNVLSTEAERLEMLRSGQVVLCHQVKGNVIE